MSAILRVFPRRTSYTPQDPLAFVGPPPLLRPDADEVHVSVTFTWDLPIAEVLRAAWAAHYGRVSIGGPALGAVAHGFKPGRYVKPGVTFTSRGCDRRCPWCLVPSREGRLLELPGFPDGNVVQDNNFLQTSGEHQDRVFEMLDRQPRGAVFAGGIDARLVGPAFASRLRSARVHSVFLAADTRAALRPLGRALDLLSFLGRKKLRVYTLIGFGNDTIEKATSRLEAVWGLGGLPFAQLYQPPDRHIRYGADWRALSRSWTRPAAMYAAHKVAAPDPGTQPDLWGSNEDV